MSGKSKNKQQEPSAVPQNGRWGVLVNKAEGQQWWICFPSELVPGALLLAGAQDPMLIETARQEADRAIAVSTALLLLRFLFLVPA